MNDLFTTNPEAPPVIARAVTVNYDQPPDWQRRAHYAMGDERRQTIAAAIGSRINDWALQSLLDELTQVRELAAGGDVICRRDFGDFGYLEITVITAVGALAARYLAVSSLPELERDVYIDALIDDYLADRPDVARVESWRPDRRRRD